LTNPHNFTLDSRTEALWEEFQELARKEHKTVSSLFRDFIVRYVEERSPVTITQVKETFPNLPTKYTMITHQAVDPYPLDKEAQAAWIKKYPRKVTVNYGK